MNRFQAMQRVVDAITDPWETVAGRKITDLAGTVPVAVVNLTTGTVSADMAGNRLVDAQLTITFIYDCEDASTEDDIDFAIDNVLIEAKDIALNFLAYTYDYESVAPHIAFTAEFSMVYRHG